MPKKNSLNVLELGKFIDDTLSQYLPFACDCVRHPNCLRCRAKEFQRILSRMAGKEASSIIVEEALPAKGKSLAETIANPPKCTCHERDSSYSCDLCKLQGYFGHMETPSPIPKGHCEVRGFMLHLTCAHFPEQYDVYPLQAVNTPFIAKMPYAVGYIRLRASFSVHLYEDDQNISAALSLEIDQPSGYGDFDTDEERALYLTVAVLRIEQALKALGR